MSLVDDTYGSSESESEEAPAPPPPNVLARFVENAPAVVGALGPSKTFTGEMTTNLPASVVRAVPEGPSHPFRSSSSVGPQVESTSIEDWSFHDQYHQFQRPSASKKKLGPRRKFVGDEDVGDEDEHGIWAPIDKDASDHLLSEEQRTEMVEAARTKKKRGYDVDEDHDRRDERKRGHVLPPRHDRDTMAIPARSDFHGDRERDYQGRSWLAAPRGMPVDEQHDCFIPKKCVHQFTGHSKGVQSIRLFPRTGHVLLSASMDATCKIWSVAGDDRRAMRTYHGHSEAVRDANFSRDGKSFASTGFDRFVRVWDTESGACLETLTANRKMCYCVDFYPRDSNVLLAGASDNKIYQWDLRDKAQIVQEYNYHLQSVNSVTFVDDDSRFVSTADDKKIFIWEYNIPVPMRYISEPHMNSVPVVELSPDGAFWCGQSLNNQIVTYQARDKLKQLRKRNFKGHLCSGYSCGLTFSPNSRYLASGDAEGRTFVWDFKSTRLLRKWHCHDAACVGVQWHPIEPSWLLTCGWDGLIKLWD